MKVARVYVDTSVFGGCFDPEFEFWSRTLFRNFEEGVLLPVVSDLVESEVLMGPEFLVEFFLRTLSWKHVKTETSDEVMELLHALQRKRILPKRFENDLHHIALAAIENVDVLVSWNFRHIVRFDKIQLFNSTIMEAGYKPIQIYSPREVAIGEKR